MTITERKYITSHFAGGFEMGPVHARPANPEFRKSSSPTLTGVEPILPSRHWTARTPAPLQAPSRPVHLSGTGNTFRPGSSRGYSQRESLVNLFQNAGKVISADLLRIARERNLPVIIHDAPCGGPCGSRAAPVLVP
jgi:hypothetical protein